VPSLPDRSLSQYTPPWYLRSGHVQTIITGFYRPLATLPNATVHRLPIGPMGSMLIHENRPDPSVAAPDAPAVLLLHGLGSSHQGTYMTNIAHGLLARGMRVFRADLPGAGPSCQFTPLPPHGACHALIYSCLEQLSTTLGIDRWSIAGVSLGGSITLRLLSDSLPRAEHEAREHARPMPFQIVRAIAVAPPIDLAASCANVEQGLNRIYARYFVRALKKQSRERAALWDVWKERLRHADFSSIRKFDETMTVHLAGFRDLHDYYSSGSSRDILHRITVPTTLLIDEHDPIVPRSLFDGVQYSASTELIRTRFGGHVGYLCRNSENEAVPTEGRFHRWADAWIVRALAAPIGSNTP